MPTPTSPRGLVSFMHARLDWDVLFVIEEDKLRRASDATHYRLAGASRTLVTLDRDYLDDRRFPPGESGGVLVIHAPDERLLSALLGRIDRALFRAPGEAGDAQVVPLPLVGRKMHVHSDWQGEEIYGLSRQP
jgi:hypothetical protein